MKFETSERSELLTVGPAEALAGLLGSPTGEVLDGASLPLLWHWVYMLDRVPQVDLAEDGHPVRGVVPTPPAPGLRRMFAGGRVQIMDDLRWGERAVRRTRVRRQVSKSGRSGALTFVTVGHEILQRGVVVIDDEQDIVYRQAHGSARPTHITVPLSEPITLGQRCQIDPMVLFRFSALTYNAHRIHYDRDYAREVEGYPGLVVHGPLQALVMAEAMRRVRPSAHLAQFSYRFIEPLFDTQGMFVETGLDGDGVAAAITDDAGRQTASARLE